MCSQCKISIDRQLQHYKTNRIAYCPWTHNIASQRSLQKTGKSSCYNSKMINPSEDESVEYSLCAKHQLHSADILQRLDLSNSLLDEALSNYPAIGQLGSKDQQYSPT